MLRDEHCVRPFVRSIVLVVPALYVDSLKFGDELPRSTYYYSTTVLYQVRKISSERTAVPAFKRIAVLLPVVACCCYSCSSSLSNLATITQGDGRSIV